MASEEREDAPLLLTVPEHAPLEDELALHIGEPTLLPAEDNAASKPDGAVDLGLVPAATDGEGLDLAPRLFGGKEGSDADSSVAVEFSSPPVPQEAPATVDTIAAAERDAAAVDLSAYAPVPAADMGTELERLLAQLPLAVV